MERDKLREIREEIRNGMEFMQRSAGIGQMTDFANRKICSHCCSSCVSRCSGVNSLNRPPVWMKSTFEPGLK